MLIAANDPQALPWALDALERGELAVIPTDTVYGLAARLDRQEALERLYTAKGREANKAIPVLISDAERLPSLTDGAPDGVAEFAARFWPGPLTIVLPCADSVPVLVTAGSGTIGVRMPAHPIALEIIEGCGGALAVTSANRSGEPSLRDAREVAEALGASVEIIVDSGMTPGGVASTVIALTDAGPHILREGPISLEELRAAWVETVGRKG
jgi:L-threonylcarbamoyladenylate synthase